MKILIPILLSFVLAAGLAFGCDSPCRELANKVCDCQTTRAKIARCEATIDSADQNIDPSDGESDVCQQILDDGTCTCEALQAGDLAACGLSEDAMDVWDEIVEE